MSTCVPYSQVSLLGCLAFFFFALRIFLSSAIRHRAAAFPRLWPRNNFPSHPRCGCLRLPRFSGILFRLPPVAPSSCFLFSSGAPPRLCCFGLCSILQLSPRPSLLPFLDLQLIFLWFIERHAHGQWVHARGFSPALICASHFAHLGATTSRCLLTSPPIPRVRTSKRLSQLSKGRGSENPAKRSVQGRRLKGGVRPLGFRVWGFSKSVLLASIASRFLVTFLQEKACFRAVSRRCPFEASFPLPPFFDFLIFWFLFWLLHFLIFLFYSALWIYLILFFCSLHSGRSQVTRVTVVRDTKVFEFVKWILRPWRSQQAHELISE